LKINEILTTVVPVGKNHDSLQLLRIWIGETVNLPMRTILVIDTKDKSTIEAAHKIQQVNVDKVSILSTDCKGPGSARNLGLSSVMTEWVCFWDSDDLAYPKVAIDLVQEADKNDYGVIIANYKIWNNNLEIETLPTKKSYSPLDLAVDPGLWRFFFKYEKIRNVKFPEIFMGEDLVFLAKCADILQDSYTSSEVTYRYTKNTKFQLTSSNQYISQLQQSYKLLRDTEKSIQSNYGKTFLKYLKVKVALTLLKRGNWVIKLKTFTFVFKSTLQVKSLKKIQIAIIFIARTMNK
jgi:glycosyltransferase involved in cell wall biosynthesis